MKLSELQNLIQNLTDQGIVPDPGKRHELLHIVGLEPGALYQELEMESRFVDTHQDTSYSNATVNLHSHSFYELLYCINTCGAEYLVGADRYRLQKGDIILIAPGVSHRPLLPEQMSAPYKRYVVWISAEFMENILQCFPEIRPGKANYNSLLRTAGTRWESLSELFLAGIREAEAQTTGWELTVVGNTVQLLAQLYRAFLDRSATPPKAEKPELLDRVMAYVEAHLAERITLTDIAHQFYVSESTISQTFRKKMGVSFYRYVTQRRLIAAKALIEEGLQLESVSERVGFSDYSAFYRAFKQEYGISPRQYRKLQEGMDQMW